MHPRHPNYCYPTTSPQANYELSIHNYALFPTPHNFQPLTFQFSTTSPSLCPYLYCVGNPVILVDPDGREIEVEKNTNGTYTVTAGVQNSNRNINRTRNGERIGEVLGQTLTDYSFFDGNNEVVKGAVINPSDATGQEFITSMKTVNLQDYIQNTGCEDKYDFKMRSGKAGDKCVNRGMPLNCASGISCEASIFCLQVSNINIK